jgi:hypothetical protein
MLQPGIEPGTLSLQVTCSTIKPLELTFCGHVLFVESLY